MKNVQKYTISNCTVKQTPKENVEILLTKQRRQTPDICIKTSFAIKLDWYNGSTLNNFVQIQFYTLHV